MTTAAIIGGGVMGGGWAARFLLNGWDVRVFDPDLDPEAERTIREVLDNARRSLPGLGNVVLPDEGALSFHATQAQAVAGAQWVQETVSERLELKQKVYAAVQEYCASDVVIASSGTGFTLSELQQGCSNAGQIVVVHPCNPVYLLPLVELVSSKANQAAVIARASEILKGIGMHPLHLRQESGAHIADRLAEAVRREAVAMVKDGSASTEDIDNAIRYGFGLSWAQMGLFESQRVAGGEADMAQLAAGQHSLRALQRIRDDNLVGLMRAMSANDWGVGALQNAQDKTREQQAGLYSHIDQLPDLSQPVLTLNRTVPLDWTDYNGHMTESRYLDGFAQSTDRLMVMIGCDAEYIASGGSYFTAETHIRHIDEVHAGHPIQVRTQVIMGEGRKMHLWHEMFEAERLLATGEHMLLHVDLNTRRSALPAPQVAMALGRLARAHAGLPRPKGLGRAIGQSR